MPDHPELWRAMRGRWAGRRQHGRLNRPLAPSGKRTTLPDGDGTVDADLEVIEVHGDRSEGPRHRETVAVHSWFTAGIEEALADGDSVYLALGSTGLEREMVSYVIARDPDGDHRFVGRCMSEGESLLRGRLGSTYNARMEAVIGSTDFEATLSLLEAT